MLVSLILACISIFNLWFRKEELITWNFSSSLCFPWMLCRIMHHVQLTQDDAARGRRVFCTGPEEVSRGADKVGDNKGSLWEKWARSEELLGSLMWTLEHCHRRCAEKHFLQCSINRVDEETKYLFSGTTTHAWPTDLHEPRSFQQKCCPLKCFALQHLSGISHQCENGSRITWWAQEGRHMITWIKSNGQLDRTGEVCSSPALWNIASSIECAS